MRQASQTQQHAKNQLQDLWRPVGILFLVMVSMAGCVTTQSETLANKEPVSTPQSTASLAVLETPESEESIAKKLVANIATTPSPTPEATPTAVPEKPVVVSTATEAQVVAASVSSQAQGKVTGYYCRQVQGYPIGDGGGYCGNMASGKVVYIGAAACGAKWQLGQKLEITGYGTVVCEDRGHLEFSQVDIYFETNQALYTSSISSRYMVITEVP